VQNRAFFVRSKILLPQKHDIARSGMASEQKDACALDEK
jgi:hypothetical protein